MGIAHLPNHSCNDHQSLCSTVEFEFSTYVAILLIIRMVRYAALTHSDGCLIVEILRYAALIHPTGKGFR